MLPSLVLLATLLLPGVPAAPSSCSAAGGAEVCPGGEGGAAGLSSKSAYRRPPKQPTLPAGCRARGVSYVGRHASRYSTDGKTCRRAEEVLGAQGWRCREPRDGYGSITRTGHSEAYGIGGRLRSLLLPFAPRGVLSPTVLRSTAKKRTQQTADHFLHAFLALGRPVESPAAEYAPLERDRELRFFDTCALYNARWEAFGKRNPEIRRCEKELVAPVAAGVSRRLGLGEGELLDKKRLDALYKECIFKWKAEPVETREEGDRRLCELFTDEDLEVLAFYKDLKEYYKKGPGSHGINGVIISCGLWDLILGELSDALEGKGKGGKRRKEAGSLYISLRFAHAETLVPLYTLLNISTQHDPLTMELFRTTRRQERWNMEDLCPMAGNVYFVPVVGCDEHQGPAVLLYHNEVLTPWPVPACGAAYACPLSTLRSAFPQDDCNWADMCHVS